MDAFLDIETTGLSPRYDQLTVVGIATGNEAGKGIVQLVGSDITPDAVLDSLRGVNILYTFNGSRFDVPFIKQRLGLNLGEILRHRDLMYDCWERNLYGGLKAVERTLKIPRRLPDITGHEAVRLWRRYQDNQDLGSLRLLLSYNREDVLNLDILKSKLKLYRPGRRNLL